MAKKQHKLEFTIEYDFNLIGISSHENDYRLSWALNNGLNFNFIKTNDLEIKGKLEEENQNFVKYSYVDEDTLNMYNLISNRCDNGFLLEEYRNIDFILMIIGEFDSNFIDFIVNKIKSVNIITLAFKIDIETLKKKSKTKLIF